MCNNCCAFICFAKVNYRTKFCTRQQCTEYLSFFLFKKFAGEIELASRSVAVCKLLHSTCKEVKNFLVVFDEFCTSMLHNTSQTYRLMRV